MIKGYQYAFDSQLYPYKLRVIVECDWEYLHKTFRFLYDDEPIEKKFMDDAASVHFVDNIKIGKKEIIVIFRKHEFMTFRVICHETFHITICYMKELNMQIGYEIGQDEHPAYVSGWAGDCIARVYNRIHDLKFIENGKEEKTASN